MSNVGFVYSINYIKVASLNEKLYWIQEQLGLQKQQNLIEKEVRKCCY